MSELLPETLTALEKFQVLRAMRDLLIQHKQDINKRVTEIDAACDNLLRKAADQMEAERGEKTTTRKVTYRRRRAKVEGSSTEG